MATTTMTVKFTPNDKGNPPGKLADAELHFTDGPLEGLKLIGFSIWADAERSPAKRDIPGASVQREWRAAHLRVAAANQRHRRAGAHPRAGARGLCLVRRGTRTDLVSRQRRGADAGAPASQAGQG